MSADMKRGTSLRYPLKEKKRITQSLTVYGSPTRSGSQLNGVDQKKPLAESFSAVTIQSEREVSVDDHSEYTPPTANGPSGTLSLRQQVLTHVSLEDTAANQVARTGSLEDISRGSTSRHASVVSRSSSLPFKDEKTVTLPTEKAKSTLTLEKHGELAQLRDTPALQFLTRKDLYKYMSSAGVRFLLNVIYIFQIIYIQSAAQEFFADRAMMELVQRIRKDPTLFFK